MTRWIELTTLGTGGAYPGENRFTASYVIRDWLGNVVLLDVGEGTQYRLRQADIPLTRISTILITHGHGDHINGLPGLLQSMYLNTRNIPLNIIASSDVIKFIKDTLEVEGAHLGFSINLYEINQEGKIEIFNQKGDKINVYWHPSCHSREAYCYTLEWNLRPRINVEEMKRQGIIPGPDVEKYIESNDDKMLIRLNPFRISYTGDTKPCDSIIKCIKDSDVIIHESTFSDDNEKEADQFFHSTGRRAALDAKNSRASLLILSHISSRYEGYEALEIEKQAKEEFKNTILTWDLARFRFII
ncbi:metal-dependent hydrolase, beta-lactamase superfamily III [Caldisphaera lagunensis DSM 15908]|uniref:Ribonuclease Z n=1 Tax=Caldisphaera lagunensis (strain DSM 15908 / JCM 11604 / ANMR 0165 / IC-154) TaxID=1056495 RepID=L0ACK8_CALLD|nr:ribonuclease Z [Caldisphaera lagunensis]AFZ71154.1 metal-dependent hydrolase, beta-lactamase superfamily III [Caldisphaera lagunensis DSM 15908]